MGTLSTDYYIGRTTFIGWYGGNYEDIGFFETKEDAMRGMNPENRLHELLSIYEGKKIKIIVEIVEQNEL